MSDGSPNLSLILPTRSAVRSAPPESALSTSSSTSLPACFSTALPVKSDTTFPSSLLSWSPIRSWAALLLLTDLTTVLTAGTSASPIGLPSASPMRRPRSSPATCAACLTAFSSSGAEWFSKLTSLCSTTSMTSFMPCSANSSMVFSKRSIPAGDAYFIIMSMNPFTCVTIASICVATESTALLESELYSKHCDCLSLTVAVTL
mmetsp:Transcript_32120/g.97121  ORF Transcript_32120/g.97121 Transcript_32120/m.97121 type:complete len:204 (+) Transcript_32120:1228-1839(+)